jgi:hypothetical protein
MIPTKKVAFVEYDDEVKAGMALQSISILLRKRFERSKGNGCYIANKLC